jgi:eukaryotic-like serine/threonine-protein kinase
MVDAAVYAANNGVPFLVKYEEQPPSSNPSSPDDSRWSTPIPSSRSSFADATVPLSRGERVAEKYLLVRHIGKGGMADVWEAQHEELKRSVAIKFLLPELLVDPAMTAAVLTRFRFEAQVSARLCERTRNIVAVYDFGSHRGQPYLVMELLPGRTLEDEITARGRLTPTEVAAILDQTAHALRAAHGLGIVHRDLKPSNFLLTQDADGSLLVKLTDFGVAKAITNALAVDQPTQTTAGSLVGSPAFMSPEQVDDRPLDARSDVWALGAVVYEALSGAACFEGPTLLRVLAKIASRQIVPIRERVPELPVAIDAWFDRALALDATDRFADADELAASFRAIFTSPLASQPTRSPRMFVIGATAALVLAIGIGLLVRAFSDPAKEASQSAQASPVQSAQHHDTPPPAPTAATDVPAAVTSTVNAPPQHPLRAPEPARSGTATTAAASAPSASAPPPAVEATPPRPKKRIDPSEIQ